VILGSRLLLVGLLVALTGACSQDSPSEQVPESTSGVESSRVTPEGTFGVLRVYDTTWTTPASDLTGLELQTTGEEWPMAVAHPDTERPPFGWPVVVYFHGWANGTPFDGLDQLASRGIVVVAPRWAPPGWAPPNLDYLSTEDYADGYWFDVAACALAAAQEVAVEYDGNPGQTTVVGFSAGVHPAARTALGSPRTDLCPDRDPIVQPGAMVAGDSQWMFQADIFDSAFEQTDSPATDTVDRILNPDRWVNLSPSFRVYLWSTHSTAWERDVDNPPAPGSWLGTRVLDGATLIEDLEQVSAFDDGRILFDDNARLLELRLRQEGVKVLHEVFPTDHSYAPGVYDRIVEVVFGVEFR